MKSSRVVVIGAGVVGACTALMLQRYGHAVTIIDPKPPGEGASFGNAGCFNASSIVPMSMRRLNAFGAVSVVSGHIRGYTNTLPLHIEILYNEYNIVAAFSVAILLLVMALVVLLLRQWSEARLSRQLQANRED